MPDNSIADVIKQLQKAKDIDERRNAAINLCQLNDKKSIPALINGLGDHEDVAIFCVLALVRIGSEAIPAIKKGLRSKKEQIRRYSAEILGELVAEETIDDLFFVIQKDKSNWVRSAAVEALERFKISKAREMLENLLLGSDEWLSASAAISLNRIGNSEINLFQILLQKLLNDTDTDHPIYVWALVEIGKKKNIGELEDMIVNSNDYKIRKMLEEIIIGINGRF